MNGDIEWDVLDRYFSGECSAEESDAIARWAAAEPAHARTLDEARRVWTASGTARHSFDVDAAWAAVRPRLDAPVGEPAPAVAPRPSRPRLTILPARRSVGRFVLPATAALLAGAAALLVWLGSPLAPSDAPAREYATSAGQRAELELPDGTRVVLNARSRLEVPAGYGERGRDVFLEGEAFFEVEHDEDARFLVHAKGAVAEDLGTEFVVRAYPDDSSLVVVVASGVVALRSDSDGPSRGVALSTGQLGRLDPSGLVSVVDGVDLERYLSWRHGTLAFRRTPFSEVVRELERWYGVEIEYEDSTLATVPITASFADVPAETALGILAQLLDVRYERDGPRVRLVPRVSTP